MVLEKTGDRKALDANDVVIFDDLGSFLLKEVGPDVYNPLVESGDLPFLLLIVSGFMERFSVFFDLHHSSGEDSLFFG